MLFVVIALILLIGMIIMFNIFHGTFKSVIILNVFTTYYDKC